MRTSGVWPLVVAIRCGGTLPTGGDAGVDASADVASGDASGQDAPAADVAVDAVADGSADGADAGAWTPKNLSNLAVWLDDTVGVTLNNDGTANTWADQSGNGNDAYITSTSGGPNVVQKALNKHNAFQCTGSCFQIDDSPSLQWGKAGFGIAMVVGAGLSDSPTYLWRKWVNAGGLEFSIKPTSSSHDLYATTFIATATLPNWSPQSTYYYVSLRGPALEIRYNGSPVSGGTATDDISAPAGFVQFGGATGNLQLLEVIAVKGSLSDADLSAIESYFKAKFAL